MLKCLFVRNSAGKMKRDPGPGRGYHEKVGASDVETPVSHSRNHAEFPRARSVATTGQHHGTSLTNQWMISI